MEKRRKSQQTRTMQFKSTNISRAEQSGTVYVNF